MFHICQTGRSRVCPFEVIPFNLTNHGTGKNYYFYTVKKIYPKGANRLARPLYHVLREIKWKPYEECTEIEKQQKFARKLVLMCDNFSENKNNDIFAFCTELIHRNWYDEIEILYGEVGGKASQN